MHQSVFYLSTLDSGVLKPVLDVLVQNWDYTLESDQFTAWPVSKMHVYGLLEEGLQRELMHRPNT